MAEKHWTQRAREKQIERLEQLILYYGGWGHIVSVIGESQFMYYASKRLGCSTRKCREYLDIILRGTIAEKEMKKDETNKET